MKSSVTGHTDHGSRGWSWVIVNDQLSAVYTTKVRARCSVGNTNLHRRSHRRHLSCLLSPTLTPALQCFSFSWTVMAA